MNNYTEQQYVDIADRFGIAEGPFSENHAGDILDVHGRVVLHSATATLDEAHQKRCNHTAVQARNLPNLLIERDALKAENERLREFGSQRIDQAERIGTLTRENERLTTAAQNACDALHQWRAAEQTNDSVELENARKSRDAAYDELRAALTGGAA